MSNTSKNILYVVFVVIVVAIVWYFGKPANKNQVNSNQNVAGQNTGTILFYGDGCPHCKNIQEYIEQNKIKDKVSFEEKEVWSNQDNAQLLTEKAKSCNLDTDSIGVPFLWAEGKCYVGEVEVKDYFNSKAGI